MTVMSDNTAFDEGAILGLDNVAIDLPIAGVGTRVLAAFIDTIILTILSILLIVAASVAGLMTENGWVFFTVYLVGGFLLHWGYFTIAEIATGGQTPGKKAFKIRVVTDDGGLPTASALTIRNLLRVIDNLIGVLLIALDPRSRRLGDRLAGTLVIHDVAQSSESLVLSTIPKGWGPQEIALIEAFFERNASLDPDRLDGLARRIVGLIERDDPDFFDGVERAPTASGTLWRAFRPDWI